MNKENNKKTEKRRRLKSFIHDSVSLPSDAFVSGFDIEMRGRKLLFLQGCRRIIKYSPEEMILAAKGFNVSIKGESLICTTYHGGAVTVEGRIDKIDFTAEEDS